MTASANPAPKSIAIDLPPAPNAPGPSASDWRIHATATATALRASILEKHAALTALTTALAAPAINAPATPAPMPLTAPSHNNQRWASSVGIVIGHYKTAGGVVSPVLVENEYAFYSKVFKTLFPTLTLPNNQSIVECVYHLPTDTNYYITTRNGRAGEGGIAGLVNAYDLLGKTAKVNNFRYDAIVETHFNGAEDPNAKGHETLALIGNERSIALAKAFAKTWPEQLRAGAINARGHSPTPGVLLRGPHERGGKSLALGSAIAPHILIEPFFGTNTTESQYIKFLGHENFGIMLLRALAEAVAQTGSA